ncbi:cytochrome b/b6 domain-containing protein [Hydrogenimonas urashimensis]|uniref:cytochrome b/b6 domain-containing protein n=1 Tax=Hydrogenimonas urashimensis TaxID=2740515 RepID=UPI0019166263|nr:cytochrome b/b6 domain-containing protein [Hydrogenimonas urashimensis]
MERKFTPLFRLWHWLMAFSVFGLLFTVLLRETFLDKKSVAAIVRQKLETFGIAIDPDQAIALAKAIRAPMWEWHYIFAVVLGVSIALRIWLMVSKQAQLPVLKVLEAESFHEKIKATIHLLLCFTIAMLALSGAFYYFHEALGFEKEAIHWVKEVHEFLLQPLLLFVTLHIAGVVRHEMTTEEAIVSRMIHGDTVR